MSSDQNKQNKNFEGGIRLAIILVGCSLALVTGYLAGIRQVSTTGQARPKPYRLNLDFLGLSLHLQLSVAALGLAVIFMLLLLLAAAIVFAALAVSRRRKVEAANRSLQAEITERKRAQNEVVEINAGLEQRVAARTSELQAANKELDTFCLSVSHDLRAPLRAIDGFSEMLLQNYLGMLDEQGQHSLQRIRSATQRMAQLIDDLLSLSRVTRTEMRHEEVNLSEMAREVVAGLRQPDQERKVEVCIAEGLSLRGDPRLLRQVLENLLGNAWKYCSKQPAARIEMAACDSKDGKRVFFVQDNGAGFDMKYVGKLFGVFQRLHSASDFPGTGVGLATVQRIIQRHGGEVWAKGSVGQGATFYFTV